MVLSLDRWAGKVAVVTGASSGVGALIAEKLAESGLKVAALARRKDRLEDLAKKLEGKKGKIYPVQADISKEEEIVDAFKWIKANLGPVHILVNCAGYMKRNLVAEGDTQGWNDTFDINVLGLSIATQEAVKDMRANNVDGHIVHINSLLGHMHTVGKSPGAGMYSASKFAVRALAETLRLELNAAKSKIKITNLSPGLIDTDFIGATYEVARLREEAKILNPEDVADAVVYALSTPPHVQIQELSIRSIRDLP